MSVFSRDQLIARFDYNPQTGHITHKKYNPSDFDDKAYYLRVSRKSGKRAEVFREHKHTSYLGVTIKQKSMFAHRAAFLMHYGYLPKFIDHINGDSFDNRICNLRAATRLDNNRNCAIQANNKTGVPGVSLNKSGKYIAMIGDKGKNIYLGGFARLEDAKAARKEAEKLLGYSSSHGTRDSQSRDNKKILKIKAELKAAKA